MNKSQIKKLKKSLEKQATLVADTLNKQQQKIVEKFSSEYKHFLDHSKTEREAVQQVIKLAEANGFVDIDKVGTNNKKTQLQKVYKIFRNRCAALAVLGKAPLEKGANIIASHIDSPRLDLKQNPLYEDLSMAFLKTHYYGGIRKYHWLAIPLAIHGVVVTDDNQTINIQIGEDPEDPVFTITDLLPHLAGKLQASKKLADVFEGEKLNLISGSLPLGDKETKNRFKLNILNILFEKYHIREEDLASAEIEIVPAQNARDVGFDRSLIGGYGQDDRICAFTSLKALFDAKKSSRSSIVLLFDKEEIGSEGNTGARSRFFEDFVSDLIDLKKEANTNRLLRKALINSECLSADVNAAIDPHFKEVHEALNAARLGYGICMTKFTGVAGKAGSSDASAEFVGKIRRLFNKNKIVWQTGELGKIDEGGGGTVAKFLAKYGMDVLDCGPAILSMHSPFEVAGKADTYMTYLGYKAFLSK